MGLDMIGQECRLEQECLCERVGLIKVACGSGQNWSRMPVGTGGIGQNSFECG